MDAQEAAAALRDAEGYEEGLTTRTAGMTNMVWGLAAPLIFLTYGTASGLLFDAGLEWAMALLWIPGAAFGGVLTAALWTSHAVSLNIKSDTKEGWKHFGINVALFLGLAGIIAIAFTTMSWNWNASVIMVIANGGFALVVAQREAGASAVCALNTRAAAVFMIFAGIGLGIAGFGDAASSALGAAATGIGWMGSGLWTFIRG